MCHPVIILGAEISGSVTIASPVVTLGLCHAGLGLWSFYSAFIKFLDNHSSF